MPRKPKGDKPMTSTERSKARRAKAKPPKSERATQLAAPLLQAAWDAADESTREAFLDKVLGGVDRSKPLWRNMAKPGSMLKGAK